MAKLTLSVNDGVILRAKQYASEHGVSVSELVEGYLDALTAPSADDHSVPPVLRSLLGVLKSGDQESYRGHIAAKYR